MTAYNIRMLLHMYVVRHGQTLFNRYNRLQGWSNSPLTEQGIADAHRAGQALADIPLCHAFCSDTTRAIQTAECILQCNHYAAEHQVDLTSDYHFREQCYGYFEGQDMSVAWTAAGGPHGAPTYQAIVQQYGLAATRDFLKAADPFHDAESDEEYWHRVEGLFNVIVNEPKLHDEDSILVISHGNTLLSLMHRFSDGRYDLTERPANGSITQIDLRTDLALDEEQAVQVITYNQLTLS